MNVDKLIEKMKRKPNGIRFAEGEKVLKAFGYSFKRQKGSHRTYMNKEGDVVVLKEGSPMKAVYVKDILKRIGIE